MHYLSTKDAKALYLALLSLKNEEECKKFLRDLLTEAEIKEFTNRWKVVRLLDAHTSYEGIEKQTGMSSTTIARISKWFRKGMGGYQLMITRLNKQANAHHTSLT
jgi:TrpR-related protein YerC/YecD